MPGEKRPEQRDGFDLQDVLLLAGIFSVIAGVWLIWRPAGALIVAGLLSIFFAWNIERAKAREARDDSAKS